jgi:ectoine hydroxylase-related dioxygenase (phytanoyl-CoA dioxygenase family)
MESSMKIIDGDFEQDGFLIVAAHDSQAQMQAIRERFEARYLSKFRDDPTRNRNVIKLLAEDIAIKRFFCSADIVSVLHGHLKIAEPVQTGPIVTHYTASNTTGNNYGLPYHQDWPSMGTSTRGVIAWTSITDIGTSGPGLRIVPGSHRLGLWPGTQTDGGYVLEQQEIEGFRDVQIEAGQILFMSPFLVHRTRTSATSHWKLSLSCRFDDFGCEEWDRRNFVSAYKTAVDRQAYLSN